MVNYSIYAITDRQWLSEGETLASAVEKAILGGATIIQLREKELEGAALKELAIQVQTICKNYGIPFIVNDNVALAQEIAADGVHIGQDDMSLKEARQILGPDKIIGVTAKTIELAQAAQRDGATYLGSGALFGSSTKTDAKPMTPQLFNSICESVDIPVVAIGGINESNIETLKGLKMSGFALVSAIFANKDIAASTRKLSLLANDILGCKQ